MQTRKWIDKLCKDRRLPAEGYRAILEHAFPADIDYLHLLARREAEVIFGRRVYVRALIEITNYCRNNCNYCGIRGANSEVVRYRLSCEDILECCEVGYNLGLKTFVLQGGEDVAMSDDWLVEMVSAIRAKYPDCAITLSLGERSAELYQRLYDAGANRYLLRHETHNAEHYAVLHPVAMSLNERLSALDTLKAIGYQTGTGIMVGSKGQTVEHIVEDIEYIEQFSPEMIGIGPFVPHHATPFADCEAGSVELTLRLISIFRLINPRALIPATTSLATLSADGRERGVLAGANVVMPNVSPSAVRRNYALYDNKASFGTESGEGLQMLGESLSRIGYQLSFDRGDYK